MDEKKDKKKLGLDDKTSIYILPLEKLRSRYPTTFDHSAWNELSWQLPEARCMKMVRKSSELEL